MWLGVNSVYCRVVGCSGHPAGQRFPAGQSDGRNHCLSRIFSFLLFPSSFSLFLLRRICQAACRATRPLLRLLPLARARCRRFGFVTAPDGQSLSSVVRAFSLYSAISFSRVVNARELLWCLTKTVNKHCGDVDQFSQIKPKKRNEFNRCNVKMTKESVAHSGGFAVQRRTLFRSSAQESLNQIA